MEESGGKGIRGRKDRERSRKEASGPGWEGGRGGGERGGEANRGRLNNIIGGVLTVPGRPRANSSPPPPPLHRSTRPTSGPSLPTPPRLSFAHAAAPREVVGHRGWEKEEPSRAGERVWTTTDEGSGFSLALADRHRARFSFSFHSSLSLSVFLCFSLFLFSSVPPPQPYFQSRRPRSSSSSFSSLPFEFFFFFYRLSSFPCSFLFSLLELCESSLFGLFYLLL